MGDEVMLLEIALGCAVAGLAAFGFARCTETPEARSWRLQSDWQARCRAGGMSWDEIYDEQQLREQFAILQHNCSFHVLTAPDPAATFDDFLKYQIEITAGFFARLDPALSKRFVRWVSGLRESDILTPDAFDRLRPMPKLIRATPEERERLAHIRLAAFTDR
jgi:hypothetical protein